MERASHAAGLKPATVRVAWLALAVALLMPPKGIGIGLCWMRSGMGIPCPGCGLTRSLSCAVRGLFHESWQYHPFGLIILALFVAVAATSLLPASRQAWLQGALNARPGPFKAARSAFLIGFVTFGVLRAVLQMTAVCEFDL